MTDQRNALQFRLSEPYKHGVECSCPACTAQTRALEEQQRTNEVESPSYELATLRHLHDVAHDVAHGVGGVTFDKLREAVEAADEARKR